MKLFNVFIYTAIALISAVLYFNPHIFWDVVAYVGVVEFLKGGSQEIVHANSYMALRQAVDSETYAYLINDNAYHKAMFENSHFFVNQLPFYSVKPFYVALGAGLSFLGLNYVDAFVLISVSAYFFTGIFLYRWVSQITGHFVAGAAVLLLLISPPMLMAGRIPSPDMISALLTTIAVYLLLEKRMWVYSFLIFIISIMIRPDNVIFFGLVIIFVHLVYQKRLDIKIGHLVLFLGISITLYVSTNILSGNYGWFTLFYHSFVERLNDPPSFDQPFTLSVYFTGILGALKNYPYSFTSLPFFLLLLSLACYFYRRDNNRDLLFFTIVILLSIIIKAVLFPDFDDRFFITHYLLIFIVFVKAALLPRHRIGEGSYHRERKSLSDSVPSP